MLSRQNLVQYRITEYKVNIEDNIIFHQKDKNTTYINVNVKGAEQLTGVTFKLKIKTPTGDIKEVYLDRDTVFKESILYKCLLPNTDVGTYKTQIITTYGDEIVNSDIFTYEVVEDL